MPDPLHGIRVLDFGRFIAGPFCAALLADLGADVVRVEKVRGGEDRFLMPVTAAGDGAYYLQVNRGKRGMTLNPRTPEGRHVLQRLVARTDVVGGQPAGRGAEGPRARLRRALGHQAGRDSDQRIGVRRRRAVFPPAGLRRDRAGDVRHHVSLRARGRADQGLLPVRRLHDGARGDRGHTGRAAGAARHRAGPAGAGVAARFGAHHRQRHADGAGDDPSRSGGEG